MKRCRHPYWKYERLSCCNKKLVCIQCGKVTKISSDKSLPIGLKDGMIVKMDKNENLTIRGMK